MPREVKQTIREWCMVCHQETDHIFLLFKPWFDRVEYRCEKCRLQIITKDIDEVTE